MKRLRKQISIVVLIVLLFNTALSFADGVDTINNVANIDNIIVGNENIESKELGDVTSQVVTGEATSIVLDDILENTENTSDTISGGTVELITDSNQESIEAISEGSIKLDVESKTDYFEEKSVENLITDELPLVDSIDESNLHQDSLIIGIESASSLEEWINSINIDEYIRSLIMRPILSQNEYIDYKLAEMNFDQSLTESNDEEILQRIFVILSRDNNSEKQIIRVMNNIMKNDYLKLAFFIYYYDNNTSVGSSEFEKLFIEEISNDQVIEYLANNMFDKGDLPLAGNEKMLLGITDIENDENSEFSRTLDDTSLEANQNDKVIDYSILFNDKLSNINDSYFNNLSEWNEWSFYTTLNNKSREEIISIYKIDEEFLIDCSNRGLNIYETQWALDQIETYEYDTSEFLDKYVLDKEEFNKKTLNYVLNSKLSKDYSTDSNVNGLQMMRMAATSTADQSNGIGRVEGLNKYPLYKVSHNDIISISPKQGALSLSFDVGELKFKDSSSMQLKMIYDSDLAALSTLTDADTHPFMWNKNPYSEFSGLGVGWKFNLPYFLSEKPKNEYQYNTREESYRNLNFSGIYLENGGYAKVKLSNDNKNIEFVDEKYKNEMQIKVLVGDEKKEFYNPFGTNMSAVNIYSDRVWDQNPTVKLTDKYGSIFYFNYDGLLLGGVTTKGEKYYLKYFVEFYADDASNKIKFSGIESEYGEKITVSYPYPGMDKIYVKDGRQSTSFKMGTLEGNPIFTTVESRDNSNNRYLYNIDYSLINTVARTYTNSTSTETRIRNIGNVAINKITYLNGDYTEFSYSNANEDTSSFYQNHLAVGSIANYEDNIRKDYVVYENVCDENSTTVKQILSDNSIGSKINYNYDPYGMPSSTYWYEGDSNIPYKNEKYNYDDDKIVEKITNANTITQKEDGRTIKTNIFDVKYNYTYDNKNNLTSIKKEVNNGSSIVLEETEYDQKFSKPIRSKKYTDTNKYITKEFILDNKGNVTKEIETADGKSKIIDYTYNGENLLTNMKTSADGVVTTVDYNYAVTPVDSLLKERKVGQYTIDQTINKNTDNITSTIAYDNQYNMISSTDPYNNVTSYKYNKFGQLIQTTNPNGTIITVEYNTTEGTVTVTDEMGLKYTKKYSGLGYLTQESASFEGDVRKISEKSYDENHNIIESTDAKGNTTRFEYNGLNELVKQILPNQTITSFNMNHTSRIKTTIDNSGNTTTEHYDWEGNLIKVVAQDNSSIVNKYDLYGKLLESTDYNGKTTKYTYDSKGRTIRVLSPEKVITEYQYDEFDRVTARISKSEAGGIEYKTSKVYNNLGQLVSEVDEKGKKTSYEYDKVGNVVNIIKPDNTFIKNEYNNMNNLVKKSYDDFVLKYIYDNSSRLIKISRFNKNDLTNPIDETTYTYDNFGLLISEDYVDNQEKSTVNNVSNKIDLYFSVPSNLTEIKSKFDELSSKLTLTGSTSSSITSDNTLVGTKSTYMTKKVLNWNYLVDVGQMKSIFSSRIRSSSGYTLASGSIDISTDSGSSYSMSGTNSTKETSDRYGNMNTYETSNYKIYSGARIIKAGYLEVKVDKFNELEGGGDTFNDLSKGTKPTKPGIPLPKDPTLRYMATGTQSKSKTIAGPTLLSATSLGSDYTSYGIGSTYEYMRDISNRRYSVSVSTENTLVSKVNIYKNSYNYAVDKIPNTTEEKYFIIVSQNGSELEFLTEYFYKQCKAKNVKVIIVTSEDNRNKKYTDSSIVYSISGDKSINLTVNEAVAKGYAEYVNINNIHQIWDLLNSFSNVDQPSIIDNSYKNTYSYDEKFMLTSMVNKFGDKTNYTYDSLDRVSTVSMNNYTFSYTYDDVSNNVSSIKYPNGMTTKYDFDIRNRLSNYDLIGAKGITVSETYTYDRNSNILEIVKNGVSNKYSYDGLNRLITLSDNLSGEVRSLEYDIRSNIVKESSNIGIDFNLSAGKYTWNTVGQSTSFTDTKGNKYGYEYGINGLRDRKVMPDGSSLNYYYSTSGKLIGSEDKNTKTSYINGSFPLAKIENGKIYYFIYNGHNDLKYIVDGNGDIQNEYDYDLWGKTTAIKENTSNFIGYTSQIYDKESGNYYLKARFYNPTMRRFISKDSYEGTLDNPVSHNMFIYCLNNPAIYYDPSGNTPEDLPMTDDGRTVVIKKAKKSDYMIGVVKPDPAVLKRFEDNPNVYNWGELGIEKNPEPRELMYLDGFYIEAGYKASKCLDAAGTVKQGLASGKFGIAILSNNKSSFVQIYTGGGPSIGSGKGVSLSGGLVLYNTSDSSKLYGISGDGSIILSGGGLEGGITTTVGSDIIGQGVSFGLAGKTPGVEATTSVTKTIIVIEMNPSPELLYEIRYRK